MDKDLSASSTSLVFQVKNDLSRYGLKEAGFFSKTKTVLLTQGIWATIIYRCGAFLLRKRVEGRAWAKVMMPFLTIMSKLMEILTGISIPFSARIGPGFYIGHFGSIIIGKDVVIGDYCNISQGVTIGQAGRGGKQLSPRIGNRVYIGPGAKIFGNISIGDDVAIGANSVVTKSLPPKAVAGGVPATVISYDSSKDFIIP